MGMPNFQVAYKGSICVITVHSCALFVDVEEHERLTSEKAGW